MSLSTFQNPFFLSIPSILSLHLITTIFSDHGSQSIAFLHHTSFLSSVSIKIPWKSLLKPFYLSTLSPPRGLVSPPVTLHAILMRFSALRPPLWGLLSSCKVLGYPWQDVLCYCLSFLFSHADLPCSMSPAQELQSWHQV